MRYPNQDKALGIHATPEQKMDALLETLELESLDDGQLHPNVVEVVRRKLLPLDDDTLTGLLVAINNAKLAYAGRQQ